MDNKGLSSLISFILVVGLTVGLIVVVVTWGMNIFKDVSESSEENIEDTRIDSSIELSLERAVVLSGVPSGPVGASKSLAPSGGDGGESAPLAGGEKQVTFVITSLSEVGIEGFRVELKYLDGTFSLVETNLEGELEPFGSQSYSFSYFEEGEVDYFEIRPIVNGRVTGYSIEFTPIVG